jgi:hypothetical protein
MSVQDFKTCDWHDTVTNALDEVEQPPACSISIFYASVTPNSIEYVTRETMFKIGRQKNKDGRV